MHIGQAEISAGVAEGQLFVVETEQVKDSGVQVVNVDAAIDGCVPEFIGLAVDMATFDAAAGQPHAEPEVIVVATPLNVPVVTLGQFHKRRAAKFTAPDDQCVFQQAAGFEVFKQRGDGT